jgi:hypothetical protein
MVDLDLLANLSQIVGAVAIVVGGIFAWSKLAEFREQRREAVAVEILRSFSEPAHAEAVNLIHELPDGASAELLRSKDRDYERAALMLAITYETIGLLVIPGDGVVLDGAGAHRRTHRRDVAQARHLGRDGAPRTDAPLVRRVVPVARRAARARGRREGGAPAYEKHAGWRPRA